MYCQIKWIVRCNILSDWEPSISIYFKVFIQFYLYMNSSRTNTYLINYHQYTSMRYSHYAVIHTQSWNTMTFVVCLFTDSACHNRHIPFNIIFKKIHLSCIYIHKDNDKFMNLNLLSNAMTFQTASYCQSNYKDFNVIKPKTLGRRSIADLIIF